jgi:hypothetical protein
VKLANERVIQQSGVIAVDARPVFGQGSVTVVVTGGGDVTVGTVGTTGVGPTALPMGGTLIVGIATAELTPRLPISIDPRGIPVRAAPPGAVGDVDVGVEEETTLLEPAPHIPDRPEVCTIPDVADSPDVDMPGVAAVAGAAPPTAIPPPS